MSDRPTPIVSGPSQPKIPSLDGIRGLAILLVMVFHFTLYSGMRTEGASGVDRFFYHVAYTGWIGVDLFFVLSGFLITGILFDSKGTVRYFRTFFMRRVLRIFPLHYGFLGLMCVGLLMYKPDGPRSAEILAEQGWYWSYLINVRFAFADWPGQKIIAHFWSLAVEEQFYLVWPFVVAMFGRTALMRICIAACVIALGLRCAFETGLIPMEHPGVAAYVLMPCRMDALLAGAFLALYLRGGEHTTERVRSWVRLAPIPAAVLVGIFFWREKGISSLDPVMYTWGFSVTTILFTLVLAWSLLTPRDGVFGRFFAHKWLRFLGKYAYGLYVFHHVVIFGLEKTPLNVTRMPRILGSQIPAQLIMYVVAGLVTTGLALASWWILEARVLKLKRLFEYDARKKSTSQERPATAP